MITSGSPHPNLQKTKKPPCKTPMLMRLMQLLRAWYMVALSAMCGVGLHRTANHRRQNVWSAYSASRVSITIRRVSQPKSHEQVFQLPHSHEQHGASRLAWLAHAQQKGGKKHVASLSVGMSRMCQTLIRPYALTNMSKNEKEQFLAQIAMHYYAMGTSYHLVKGMHLKAAIKLLYPHDNMLPAKSSLPLHFSTNVTRSSRVRSMCTWRVQQLALQVMSGPTSRMAPLWSTW